MKEKEEVYLISMLEVLGFTSISAPTANSVVFVIISKTVIVALVLFFSFTTLPIPQPHILEPALLRLGALP